MTAAERHPCDSQLSIRAEIETKGVSGPVPWDCVEKANADGSLTVVTGKYTWIVEWREGI